MVLVAFHIGPARIIQPARLTACIQQKTCRHHHIHGDDFKVLGGTLRWTHQLVAYGRRNAIYASHRSRQMPVVANSGRSVHFESEDTYVIMEPGQDECFLSEEELKAKLRGWLEQWPKEELSPDLANFPTIDEAISYLINSVCELELGGGKGTVQWFQVRLESESETL